MKIQFNERSTITDCASFANNEKGRQPTNDPLPIRRTNLPSLTTLSEIVFSPGKRNCWSVTKFPARYKRDKINESPLLSRGPQKLRLVRSLRGWLQKGQCPFIPETAQPGLKFVVGRREGTHPEPTVTTVRCTAAVNRLQRIPVNWFYWNWIAFCGAGQKLCQVASKSPMVPVAVLHMFRFCYHKVASPGWPRAMSVR